MRIAFIAVILVFSFLVFVPQVSAAQIIQVYIVWHRQYPMWLATYQICDNVYIQASGGIMHTVPAYQLHVNNTMYDITRYGGRSLYIEIVATGNGYIIYPFNVSVTCSRFRFNVSGDVWLHVERNVSDGQLIDHKLYENNGLRLIPYPHTFEYRVDVLGRINTQASTTRYTSNVMYHFIVRTDSGTVIDRVVDSGVYNFTLEHAVNYIEAYTYAVISDDSSNSGNSSSDVAKASPIDFSSIYSALSGNRSLPIVLIIVLIIVALGVLARR